MTALLEALERFFFLLVRKLFVDSCPFFIYIFLSGVDCACPSHTVEVDSKVIRDGDMW